MAKPSKPTDADQAPEQTDNRDRPEDPKQVVSQDPQIDYSEISDHSEDDS